MNKEKASEIIALMQDFDYIVEMTSCNRYMLTLEIHPNPLYHNCTFFTSAMANVLKEKYKVDFVVGISNGTTILNLIDHSKTPTCTE